MQLTQLEHTALFVRYMRKQYMFWTFQVHKMLNTVSKIHCCPSSRTQHVLYIQLSFHVLCHFIPLAQAGQFKVYYQTSWEREPPWWRWVWCWRQAPWWDTAVSVIYYLFPSLFKQPLTCEYLLPCVSAELWRFGCWNITINHLHILPRLTQWPGDKCRAVGHHWLLHRRPVCYDQFGHIRWPGKTGGSEGESGGFGYCHWHRGWNWEYRSCRWTGEQ